MINTTSSPGQSGGLNSHPFFFNICLCQALKVSLTVAFAILGLVLNISSASAQTQDNRPAARPQEPVERVDDIDRAGADEADKHNIVRQAPANSLVKRTALSYTPRTGNQSAPKPVLVDDIKIISRASDESPEPLGHSTTPRAVTGIANIPSIWPVRGPLTDGFGGRSNPFGGTSWEFHKGQDISAARGAPVMATADGTVVSAGWKMGYGLVVYIYHGNGISTRYGHLSRIDVAEGQVIKQGEQLGLVGSTGRSTAPHLHYEVRVDNYPMNPRSYLPSGSPANSAR
ncbi:MAG: M23 family metallopeptidase [Nitrosomonas sp.]|nr:M23 family metallopeptidase [Nitrosomonas sp.]